MARTVKAGQHVYTRDGRTKHHGTVVEVRGRWAVVKFWEFVVPREVPVRALVPWLHGA